ncbi:hypothetical protein QH494_08055 [Sphingomonas sp. AR_OL41]|uniref:hypothetical protein n=1 Tax=Sphingomonas sp. AR_OL41 TaxID=3042729 RepID=UPI00247FF90A|nr:hypothetical protein [Sphingomonas sp. AR_OL41]MDH7972136.1 hypothetical protein [Sphingomonas sp. AR_OL41]
MVIVALLLGIGWLRYTMSAPSAQVPTSVRGTITSFRLGAYDRGVEPPMQVAIALQDGTETVITIASDDASACRIGDSIALDRYVDHWGHPFFRAAFHPCDLLPARRALPRK